MKREFLDAIAAADRDSRSAALATELATGRQALLDRGTITGDLTLDAAAQTALHTALREALRTDRTTTLDLAGDRVLIEVFSPPRRCFIIGAVHIAQPLTQILALTDFRTIVIDPRQAFATAERFPGIELSTDWPDEALARYQPDHRSAMVALTHDPKIDDPGLTVALRSECFYIGALGSRRTHGGRLQRLAAAGFGEADLARIRGPIGLPIGGVSQAEVAVSIVAEMIQVLRRGAGETVKTAAAA